MGAPYIYDISHLRFKKCRGIHREKGLAGKWPKAVERGMTG